MPDVGATPAPAAPAVAVAVPLKKRAREAAQAPSGVIVMTLKELECTECTDEERQNGWIRLYHCNLCNGGQGGLWKSDTSQRKGQASTNHCKERELHKKEHAKRLGISTKSIEIDYQATRKPGPAPSATSGEGPKKKARPAAGIYVRGVLHPPGKHCEGTAKQDDAGVEWRVTCGEWVVSNPGVRTSGVLSYATYSDEGVEDDPSDPDWVDPHGEYSEEEDVEEDVADDVEDD